jgi:UDP-N-acetylmuramoyl-tripeptide--D-alanyl-D-alanine ligase
LTLLAASPEDQWLLVEVGTNAPGEIAALTRLVSPQVAIITGIGRAHLGGFGGEQEVATEKASMLDHVRAQGHAIVQADSDLIHPELEARASKPIRFTTYGRNPAADLRLTGRQPFDGSQRIEIDGGWTTTLSLPGEHNAVNALAVIALARHLGMSDEDIATGLGRVEPAPGRMEPVEVAGIHAVHDAYNANPESMVAALVTFAETAAGEGRKVAVLGEMRELGEQSEALHREVGAAAARAGLDLLVGVGAGGMAILDGARAAGHAGKAVAVTLEDDVSKIAGLCHRGDRVLLKASRGVRLERVLDEWKSSETPMEGRSPA